MPFDAEHVLRLDPLVECFEHGLKCRPAYVRDDGLNYPYEGPFRSATTAIHLRKSLIMRLLNVNETLVPYGVELCLLDGYRRIETQREIWDFYCRRRRILHPEYTDTEIDEFAAVYASDPRSFSAEDPKSWPVHCTGGAIDLTLMSLSDVQEPVYMGGIFDDPSPVSHSDFYERASNFRSGSASDEMAQRYRRLLYHAMYSQGFKNYPAEWWHYDWGDQMWAQRCFLNGNPCKAFYGYVESP